MVVRGQLSRCAKQHFPIPTFSPRSSSTTALPVVNLEAPNAYPQLSKDKGVSFFAFHSLPKCHRRDSRPYRRANRRARSARTASVQICQALAGRVVRNEWTDVRAKTLHEILSRQGARRHSQKARAILLVSYRASQHYKMFYHPVRRANSASRRNSSRKWPVRQFCF